MSDQPRHQGDPRHPDHAQFLQALGRFTYVSARAAGVAFDLLRVLGGCEAVDLYPDSMGDLTGKLRKLSKGDANLPARYRQMCDAMDVAVTQRNNVAHAWPVRDGLQRRRKNGATIDYFCADDLDVATEKIETAWRLASEVLYADGGRAVRDCYLGQLATAADPIAEHPADSDPHQGR